MKNGKLLFLFVATLFSTVFLTSGFVNLTSFNSALNNNIPFHTTSEDWIKTYGTNGEDFGICTAIDSKGNVFMVGQWDNYTATLIKYSSAGNLIWAHNLTGFTVNAMAIFLADIAIDSNDNLVIAGSTREYSNGPQLNILVAKYNNDGILQWYQTWGDGSLKDHCSEVTLNSGGDIFIVGYTETFLPSSSVFILRYSSAGTLEWNRTWGLSGSHYGEGIAIDSMDNIFVSATTDFGSGPSAMGLICYNMSGHLQWNTTWGSYLSDENSGIAIDSEDNLYLFGRSAYPDNTIKFALIKFNNLGYPQWARLWGGSDLEQDRPKCILIDSNDKIYVAGTSPNFGTDLWDMYVARFNSVGTMEAYVSWSTGDLEGLYDLALGSSTNDLCLTGYSRGFSLDKNAEMILVKNPTFTLITDNQPTDSGIPGFNLLTILVAISAIVIFLMKKWAFKIN